MALDFAAMELTAELFLASFGNLLTTKTLQSGAMANKLDLFAILLI